MPSQFHGRGANTRRPPAMLKWFFGARTLDDHLQAGHFAPALEILDGALKAQPEEPELLEKRALVLERLGRGAEAGEVLVKLAKRFADRGFGLRAIALLKKAQQLATPPAGLEAMMRDIAALAHLDDVAASPLFRMFTRDELVAIVRQLQLLSFEPGHILLMQGQPGDSLFVIAAGEVRVFAQDGAGKPTAVAKIPAPAFFGEIAVVRGGARTATITAASPVTVLELTLAGLDAISADRPNVRKVLVEFAELREGELQRQGLLKGHART
jgi:CRP-like cAMP-binding protein